MKSETFDPQAEGIRDCLRCGKKIRVVNVKGEDFQVEVDAKGWEAEHLTLVVKYEMHAQNCTNNQ